MWDTPSGIARGLGPDKLDIDREVAHLSAWRWVKPAQELAQAVAVRDDVHSRQVGPPPGCVSRPRQQEGVLRQLRTIPVDIDKGIGITA